MDLAGALESLRGGLVVGLPTDTVYGIGADPMRRDSVERLFLAKQRPEIKPIPILAGSIADVRRIAVLDPAIVEEVERHWPGALTLILPKADGLPEWIGNPQRNTVGVRVPDHPVTSALLAAAGPLAVTSANLSGQPPTSHDAGARSVFGDAVATYLPGVAGGGLPSTVVDLTGERPVVMRAGSIVWSGS
jgi:tRNA threonylcarbamoyl adenosine modification protein (Sua5/YciO/YrdC/YwlC family)